MKLRRAGLVVAALAIITVLVVLTLVAAEDAPSRSRMAILPTCLEGAVVLSDTDCDELSHCMSKTMRLTWSREGGSLFEGDGVSEREVRRLSGGRLGALIEEVATAIDVHDRDGIDRVCALDGHDTGRCPVAGRKLGLNADCSGVRMGTVVMRSTFLERWEGERFSCFIVDDRIAVARCKAENLLRRGFGTHLTSRVITTMERLRKVARETEP
jgi:hypothetical protein